MGGRELTTSDAEDPTGGGRFVADVFLHDGRAVRIRAIRDDDGPRLLALSERCSERTLYYRFFTPPPLPVTQERLDFLTHVDHRRREAFVAVVAEPQAAVVDAAAESVVAVARWDADPDDPGVAEVAFLVEDAYQGLGLGSLLLQVLVQEAQPHGIHTFTATVLAENRAMLAVFRRSGFRTTHELDHGTFHVEFPVRPTAATLQAAVERERRSMAATVPAFLEPSRVAIVGAGRDSRSLGARMLRNVVRGDFTGAVHPVNPHAAAVAGIAAVPSVAALDGPVDLAVVVVPKDDVAGVVEECGRHGVKSVLVVSGGWRGRDDPDAVALAERCHALGMRMVGPSSMGVVNTSPLSSLHLTVGEPDVSAGVIGVAAQGGALGLGVLEHMRKMHLGVSQFVSMGDRVDVSSNDLLSWWEHDDATRCVLLYLETFGNPRTFGHLARRIGRTKPICAVVTGDVAAGPGAQALFAQSGIVRTTSLEELVDVAALLSTQPVPTGDRVAIVTNARNAGRLAAEACVDAGLVPVELGEDAAARTVPFASPSAAGFRTALAEVAARDDVDCVLVVYVPPTADDTPDVATAVVQAAARSPHRVFAAAMLGAHGVPPQLRRGRTAVPSYPFPETAARVLGHAARYGAWRAGPVGATVDLDDATAEVVRGAVAEASTHTDGDGTVTGDTARAVFAAAGVDARGGTGPSDPYPSGDRRCTIVVDTDGSFGPVVGVARDGTAGTGAADTATLRIVPLTDVDTAEVAALALPDATDDTRAAFAAVLGAVSAVVDAEVRIERCRVDVAVDPDATGAADAVAVVDASISLT